MGGRGRGELGSGRRPRRPAGTTDLLSSVPSDAAAGLREVRVERRVAAQAPVDEYEARFVNDLDPSTHFEIRLSGRAADKAAVLGSSVEIFAVLAPSDARWRES